MQADELKLRSKMDHMRWNLVKVVIERLPERMRELAKDETRYAELIQAMLKQAAGQIDHDSLEVSFNQEDLRLLKPQWDKLTAGLDKGKTFKLLDAPIDAVAGCLITTPDKRVQIDHTFEGRLSRLERKIHQALVERLLPPISEGQTV